MASKEELVQAFKEFDKDGSGFISTDELKQVIASIGIELSDEEIKEMFKEVDKSGDGRISFDEFASVLSDK
jgi:calmodulin